VLALGDGSEEAAGVWDVDNTDVGAVHLSMARLDVDEDMPAVESAMFHLAEVGLYKLTHSLKAPGFNP
jgi:hypothetical protein